ncbi:MAG: AgmX/PglI C-terminal domain-containing protein [Bdellovibrionales bacterium]|nr:AgmX/PglI C-terminal domain-containing protein [Bdellovibrionales bacterium]
MRFLILLLVALPAFAARPMPKAPKSTIKRKLKDAIKTNHRDFEACGKAEHARTKKPVKGTLTIRYVVNGDGKLSESGIVHNTTNSRALAECVMKALEKVKFPATFGAPLTSSYPFKFNVKK